MEENKDKPVISISQMAQELHAQYRYYWDLYSALCKFFFPKKCIVSTV